MNSGETNTRDAGVVGAYRAASEALDEHPQPGTRAAILAAAARAVDAQPRDAATGAMARRSAPHGRARARALVASKRPLALVASFLVATVALVLATQTTQHQAPTELLTEAKVSAEQSVAPEPAVQARVDEKRDTQPNETRDRLALATAKPNLTDKLEAPAVGTTSNFTDKQREAPASVAPGNPARKQAAPAAASPATPPAAAPAQALPKVADANKPARPPTEKAASVESAPPASAPASVAAGVTAAAPQPPQQAGERAKESDEAKLARAERRVTTVDADASAQGRLAKAKPVDRTAALAEPNLENDPARWMERVIALRDAGHDADADRELTRLRERYPDFQVPPNALRRTGTR